MVALVCGGRIRGDKKNGGSGGVGASSSDGTKSLGCSGSGMYTVAVWQPPHKDPQMGYSMIVPQSEQKY
ncbi:hypothetical protein Tco_0833534, partial [Tanacetum coccineum]